MMPQRIQRKRTRGWKMPPGVVYVGRPTQWGNPFKAGEGIIETAQEAVTAYRACLDETPGAKKWIAALCGKDLACWCPIGAACHADVLLEIANSPDVEAQVRGQL